MDVTVCVYAPRKTQIERLSARDSTDTELAEKILAKQMDIEEKKVRAQFVLNNTADRSALRIEVQSFLDRYFY